MTSGNEEKTFVTVGWDGDRELRAEIPADIAAAIDLQAIGTDERIDRLEKILQWVLFVLAQVPRNIEIKTRNRAEE